ncbi:P-loop NTPase fold protein [Leptothoe spongobia]|uniref:ATP-binding protein n=1 Tax=Leptothoe spongobia TAU-MAC 1115 TaxID=1967444 RepID=A0A947GM43_9CYAN|nr:P-loop NTPase fold protein [Leptothoe spongobia]MBT9317758.1 ATP-binding protein [Leptothoe spongobia TAU-MAC 1115]
MTSLQKLIQQNLNPFDQNTFRPGNFWQERPDVALEVNGIHWPILQTIDQIINQIGKDHATRTFLLTGDRGAGKSYLLGRIKRQLNDKAFFAYIGPWPDSDYLWRHTLRNTVDSLIYVPEGQSQSQMLLWLKGLPSLHHRSLAKWVLGERGRFIQDLQASFPVGIYNGKEFFGVLYDLATNPELRTLAYSWLKGDNLDKEELKLLRVKQPIDSEDAAQKILNNIGRIATSTQPIVLCFDNLDSIPKLLNNKLDLQSLFNLNSTIHNEKLRNFLVLISLVNGTWRENRKDIQPADLDRIQQTLQLKSINLDQAEALWAARLESLHLKARPKPSSGIAPLSRNWLEHYFPGKKTFPRKTLDLGRKLIDYYKHHGKMPDFNTDGGTNKPDPIATSDNSKEKNLANFQLAWDKEFQSIQKRVTRIGQFTSPELIWRLRQVLEALELPQVETQFLRGSKYASYSLSHQQQKSTTGIIWNEDSNMTTFYHVMNACQKVTSKNACKQLYLIRAAGTGKPKTKGNQIYCQVFNGKASYAHFRPDLLSVQYLETYHQLASSARAGELVLGEQTPHLKDLQSVVRESEVLGQCPLLQQLQIVEGGVASTSPSQVVADYIVNLMATQSFIGLLVLIETTRQQFSNVQEQEIEQEIQNLCNHKRLQLLDPHASREAQLICYVPT